MRIGGDVVLVLDGLLGIQIHAENQRGVVHFLVGHFDSPAARIPHRRFFASVANQDTTGHKGVLGHVHRARLVIKSSIVDLCMRAEERRDVAVVPDV